MPEFDALSVVAVDDAVRVDFTSADGAVLDATGSELDLPVASLDVVSLTLVDLARSPAALARHLGLTESGGFLHGARWGVLSPVDGRWRVGILTADDTDATESRLDVGRLSDRDVERWAPLLDGRTLRVVVFVEATSVFAGIDARFRRDLLGAPGLPSSGRTGPTRDDLDRAAPPAAPPLWYVDPADSQQLRYWDGAGWTLHTAPR